MAGKPRKKPAPKQSTKPWEEKPWVQDKLALPKEHKGFKPRFVNENRVQEYINRGFVKAKMEDYGVQPLESSGVGTEIRRGTLILMEQPNEQAKHRERQKKEFVKMRSKTAADLLEEEKRRINKRAVGSGISLRQEQRSRRGI